MDNIEVRVHREIKDYRERYYGFTARQVITAICALVIVVPIYLLTHDVFGDQIALTLGAIPASPFILVGWVQFQGLDFEKIFQFILRDKQELNHPLRYETDDDVSVRRYYYSHLPPLTKFKISFSSKSKKQADAYFAEIHDELIVKLHDDTLPKKIKVRKFTSEDKSKMAEKEAAEKQKKAEDEAEKKVIKERTDAKKQAIDDNIVTNQKAKAKDTEDMTREEKQQLFTEMFSSVFGSDEKEDDE